MPKFYSTNNPNHLVSLQEAVFKGLAPDNGLYMPQTLNKLPLNVLHSLKTMSLKEISVEMSKLFLMDDLSLSQIEQIVDEAINFDIPIISLTENISILELFHGPTCAFKDFGGRFMSRLMRQMLQHQSRKIYILVATSGDTGSAVASGFYNVEGIEVVILYPSKKVSYIQEQQLTTLGKNIKSLEIQGTFDDCQRLVKQAFLDNEIQNRLSLTSANSINIARLIPQSFYYAYTAAQNILSKKLIFSVPSGNYGNLTAGLLAQQVGLPIYHFIAASNENKTFLEYIQSGQFLSQPSVSTISNAMDVGNPSNIARIQNLFHSNLTEIKNKIFACAFNDLQTKDAMKRIYDKYQYILDPHTAVAYLGIEEYQKKYSSQDIFYIALETAHPAKFGDVVKDVLGVLPPVLPQLNDCLTKDKKSILMDSSFSNFKNYLLTLN